MPAKKKAAAAKNVPYSKAMREKGYKQVNVFLSEPMAGALRAASGAVGCANQSEFVEMIFSEWIEGTDLLTQALKDKILVN